MCATVFLSLGHDYGRVNYVSSNSVLIRFGGEKSTAPATSAYKEIKNHHFVAKLGSNNLMVPDLLKLSSKLSSYDINDLSRFIT
jgi:hypothetical protein